jgi:hypothetical protein
MRCAPVLVAVLLAAAPAMAQQPAAPPGLPATPPGAAPAPGAPPAPGAIPQPGVPWPGYAPSTYGAPPGAAPVYYAQPYAQPYYYPPPMTVLPPATLAYSEGDPVPPGYELKMRPVRSLVLAGAITFGTVYLVSALAGASLVAADSNNNLGFAPMFAPFVGPFVTIGTQHASGAGALWLVLDGLGQIAGATMLIYGLVNHEQILKRTPYARITHPEVLVGPGSTALRWQF